MKGKNYEKCSNKMVIEGFYKSVIFAGIRIFCGTRKVEEVIVPQM